jgi:hypothetical protein
LSPEPIRIVEKIGDRQRHVLAVLGRAALGAETLVGVASFGVRKIGRECFRLQVHAQRHVAGAS